MGIIEDKDIKLHIDRETLLQEYIPRKDYETRLKADLVAMLEELNLEIDEMFVGRIDYTVDKIQDLIQQKINKLKGEEDGNENKRNAHRQI